MESRYVRQEDFVPMGSLDDQNILIVGCGAIGRQVAIQLVAIGAKKITLCDFDEVSLTNVTTQGYLECDIGQDKVEVLSKLLKKMEPSVDVDLICDRFRSQFMARNFTTVVMCVDRIDARAEIWEASKDVPGILIIDGRMLGEQIRVITVSNHASHAYYPSTLFPQSQQVSGRCTGQSTIYTANIAGGLMVHQFTRHLRNVPLDIDITFDLLSGDLFYSNEPDLFCPN